MNTYKAVLKTNTVTHDSQRSIVQVTHTYIVTTKQKQNNIYFEKKRNQIS